MKLLTIPFTIVVLAISMMACKSGGPNTAIEYKSISVSEARKLIKDDNSIVILDVRTPEEVQQGHVTRAINIDVTAPTFNSEIEKLDTSKTYLVYCRSGKRSLRACNKMAAKGFSNLINMEGGYLKWSQQ